MNEFPLLGAVFAVGIVAFSFFMILNVGKNVSDENC